MPERPRITVYSPQADVRTPVALLRSIILDFRASWEMAWVIVVRNIKGEYMGACPAGMKPGDRMFPDGNKINFYDITGLQAK